MAGGRTRILLAALVSTLLLAAPAVGVSQAAAATSTELFLSEYIEGSSNNKALEIYNGTGSGVDLAAAGYSVQMFFNGSTTAGLTLNLSGTVVDGDVFVFAHSSAAPEILAEADQTNGAGWFNGNDAIVLRRGTTVVDSVGQVGLDPGAEWGSGLTSTADNTLRRKQAVVAGDTNTSDVFDPATEWDGFALDTFGGLGSHLTPALTCPAATGPPGTTIDAEVTAADVNGTVTDITISSIDPDPGTISRTAFTAAGGTGGTAAATITASDATPEGTYSITLVATNDDAIPESGTCTLTLTVAEQPVCDAPATFIHEVQGSGTASPLTGNEVSIEGVVVGDYQGTGQFGGYYVQEEDADADGDPATSEGIFSFDTATPVDVGDLVRVRGTVIESFNLTELTSVDSVLVCGEGHSVTPTPIALPVPSLADWERYEGMQVGIGQELSVTEVFTLARFGEVSLSVGGRLDSPTSVVAPGAPALALQDLNHRSRILLDDGNSQQNIDPTFYPQGGLSAVNTLRVGDSLPSLTGVLDQRFGAYRVQPIDTTTITFHNTNPRTAAPDDVGGDVKVASFNVLNYFNGDGQDGGFPTSRGASSLAEFNRQRDKIVSAIDALDADIIGLMELENDDPDAEFAAIEDLVAGLNAIAGPGTYAFVDTGIVGTDAIRVGIIYRPAVVSPAGAHAIIDSSVDPRFIDTKNRPSIAQTFDFASTGARFTVVVNHLKSKGSGCDDVGDPDTGDGQGNCNGTRTLAAEALVDWLATDPTGSGDPDVLLIGDMNAYAKEDPITAFRGAGYVDTVAAALGDGAYSFVFQGQSGYLDHALASPSLDAQVAGVTAWHINADEPIGLDYNVEFKTPNQVNTFYAPDAYRSSDHDPVLVGLDLNAAPTVDAGGPYAVVEGSSVVVTASGSDPDGDSITYAWDLDNDGTFETLGQSATFSAAGLQAPDSRTIRVRGTDSGGFVATDTAVVNVIWDFSGFFAPVSNPPALNTVRAGSVVPVRFSLGGDQGLAILGPGSPASVPVACDSGAPLGPAEPTATAGNQGLTYDASADTYLYAWKTVKEWTGCRRLVVALADGTVHHANFLFP